MSFKDFRQMLENLHLVVQALPDLFNSNRPLDLTTLQEDLLSKKLLIEAGYVSYLSQLFQLKQTEQNAEKKILLTDQLKKMNAYKSVKDLIRPIFCNIKNRQGRNYVIDGIPSGFTELDNFTNGFQNSDLIILASRPSMGKTALCLNIAQHAAIHTQKAVLLFSLEMSHPQIITRLISSEAQIDGHKVRQGSLSDEELAKLSMAVGQIEKSPILIDDTARASLTEICDKTRLAYSLNNIGMVIIDYLQLISRLGMENMESRQQMVATISGQLKGLARELNIPVICVSQLSRAVESRTDKRPMLSDFRESGAIEQDADVVLFLYREEYYAQNEENKGKCEVIIAKQRNGPVGSVELAFNPSFARFNNLEICNRISKK